MEYMGTHLIDTWSTQTLYIVLENKNNFPPLSLASIFVFDVLAFFSTQLDRSQLLSCSWVRIVDIIVQQIRIYIVTSMHLCCQAIFNKLVMQLIDGNSEDFCRIK